jgi:hypothetical protein
MFVWFDWKECILVLNVYMGLYIITQRQWKLCQEQINVFLFAIVVNLLYHLVLQFLFCLFLNNAWICILGFIEV